MALPEGLAAHLATGVTTLCRAWALTRRDGLGLGFTDHDRDLGFDGVVFRADSGMSARALQQTTGLSVDETEAEGILSHAGLAEEDLRAGRWDGAEVRIWLVNWASPEQRVLRFRGTLGEVGWRGGAFRAELRGLSDALGVPRGRAFTRTCSAVLGDGACRVDLDAPGRSAVLAVETVEGARSFRWVAVPGFADRWFERGRLQVLDGPASGLVGQVKLDRIEAGGGRRLELWEALPAAVTPGQRLRIEAGCDKRPETCRGKFDNFLNFRGFPHLPTEDWLTLTPGREAGG